MSSSPAALSKEIQKFWLEKDPLDVTQPDLLWGADLCQQRVRSARGFALPTQQKSMQLLFQIAPYLASYISL